MPSPHQINNSNSHGTTTNNLENQHDTNTSEEEEVALHFVTVEEMRRVGLEIVGYRKKQLKRAKQKRRNQWFKQTFGISHLTASHVCCDLQTTDLEGARIVGSDRDLLAFLMALYYLKKYPTEADLERIFGYCQYTSRQKVWSMVENIQCLKEQKILWNDDGVSVWDLAVDGVHTKCNEPTHAVWSQDKKYYSHKCKHAGYGYELGTRLHTNQLAWMNGPYPAGMNDISVFKRKGLRRELRRREKKAIGDKGYTGSPAEISVFIVH